MMPRVPRVLLVSFWCLWLVSLSSASGQVSPAAQGTPGEVLVLLWFDTEDYLLPASDDAARRVAEILSARGIRGTFKIVGEKARVLERRGRGDVIAALKRHDIGYHSNLHSVHPTPAEYLADAGWSEGVSEFARREGTGARDVMRVLGVPYLSCYGQPGSSWAPQAFAALGQIGVVTPSGVSTYVDEGGHVGLAEQPFWYAGALTVFDMGRNATRMPLHEPGGLAAGRAAFHETYERLRARGGGLISIYYHPAEWVHREFWDAVNFLRGANPPREEWRQPPQRPPAETEAAFRGFEAYVDVLRSLPGVRFVTASDLPAVYRDRLRTDGIEFGAARDLASQISHGDGLDVLSDRRKRAVSPADQFAIVIGLLAETITRGATPAHLDVPGLVGPPETPPPPRTVEVPWAAFRDAAAGAADEMRARRHVPARVFVGALPVAPADFLRAAAVIAAALPDTGPPGFPGSVPITGGVRVATERFVAEDSPALFDWVIHPAGFHAPRIMELARLQAWTLKPAER
jgi:hypothetical protein